MTTAITTSDGFVFTRQDDGTYSDGDLVFTAAQIVTNGRDSDNWDAWNAHAIATTPELW